MSLLQYFTYKKRKKGDGDSSDSELEEFSSEGESSLSVQQAAAAQKPVEAAGSSDVAAFTAVRTESLVSPPAYVGSSNASCNNVGNYIEDIAKGTQLSDSCKYRLMKQHFSTR